MEVEVDTMEVEVNALVDYGNKLGELQDCMDAAPSRNDDPGIDGWLQRARKVMVSSTLQQIERIVDQPRMSSKLHGDVLGSKCSITMAHHPTDTRRSSRPFYGLLERSVVRERCRTRMRR